MDRELAEQEEDRAAAQQFKAADELLDRVEAELETADAWDAYVELLQREAETEAEYDRIAAAEAAPQPPAEGEGAARPGAEGARQAAAARPPPPRQQAPRQGPPQVSQPDLLGDDTRSAQTLADERRRDEKRSPADVPVETGRPDDLFSQARQQVDIEDKGVGAPSDDDIRTHIDEVEQQIAEGRSNADLIPESGDSTRAIAAYEQALEKRGWQRFTRGRGEFLRKGNAELFLRS